MKERFGFRNKKTIQNKVVLLNPGLKGELKQLHAILH